MTHTLESLGIDKLPVAEKLALVEQLWDSIAAEDVPESEAVIAELVRRSDHALAHPETLIPWEVVKAESLAQRAELERRCDDDDANPDDVVPWEVVKAAALARWRK